MSCGGRRRRPEPKDRSASGCGRWVASSSSRTPTASPTPNSSAGGCDSRRRRRMSCSAPCLKRSWWRRRRDRTRTVCGQLATLIKEELDAARPGAAAVAADLASALLVMVVRNHLEREHTSDGMLRLLGHPQAGRAVAAMLAEPGRAWSLDELAGRANASRASLVRMFRRMAEVAPLAFLAELRLQLARRKLSARPCLWPRSRPGSAISRRAPSAAPSSAASACGRARPEHPAPDRRRRDERRLGLRDSRGQPVPGSRSSAGRAKRRRPCRGRRRRAAR